MPPPPARLLDLTRLVSRLGRGAFTGVDRVELAWLRHLVADPVPLFALVRTGPGFVLLDRDGARAVLDRATGAAMLGRADLMSHLMRRDAPLRARAEADVRRIALARVPPVLLGAMVRRRLPRGTAYLNFGHANLSERVFATLHRAIAARIAVLVHDTIPLDHPEFTRAGTFARFARKMRAVATHADLVIYSTLDARARAEVHFAAMGRVPPAVVAPLGVDLARPDPLALPPGLDLSAPFFLTLGTIEPRKNHAFLLDLWDQMQAMRPEAAIPRLILAGARGWADAAVLARLDRATGMGRTVIECSDLSDGAVAALMERATALLFPTLAEGFGLPAAEAMGRGLPVICPPLPVFREILGDYPVYLSCGDSYSWLETMDGLVRAAGAGAARQGGRAVPGWDSHFNKVLSIA